MAAVLAAMVVAIPAMGTLLVLTLLVVPDASTMAGTARSVSSRAVSGRFRARPPPARSRGTLRRLRLTAGNVDPMPSSLPSAAPIVPAEVPVGRVLPLAGRGELFFRHHPDGPAGAPTVLLLHGWTASADLQFWALYERLGRSHPFVAPDHRGHGRGLRSVEPFTVEAAADDAAALVVALGVGPVIALGYSMGGPIALALAQRHPHLVSGLVLEATALEFHTTLVERARWVGRALLEPMLRSRLGAAVARRGLAMAKRHNPAAQLREPWLLGELRRGDPVAFAEAARSLHHFDARPWAGALGLPTAVLLTTKDQVVPPAKQRALAAAVRAETVELHGDHFAPWFRGPEYAAATERLVASVTARLRDARLGAMAATP